MALDAENGPAAPAGHASDDTTEMLDGDAPLAPPGPPQLLDTVHDLADKFADTPQVSQTVTSLLNGLYWWFQPEACQQAFSASPLRLYQSNVCFSFLLVVLLCRILPETGTGLQHLLCQRWAATVC